MVALGGDGRGVVRAGGFLREMATAIFPFFLDIDTASFSYHHRDFVAHSLADADPNSRPGGMAGSGAGGVAGGSL